MSAPREPAPSPLGAHLLKTKLRPPLLGAHTVVRPRLLERLQRSEQRALTLISAQAGAGKTTLVTQWLEQADLPWAWVSLDPGDSNLRTFLAYTLAAIHTLFPRACASSAALLAATTTPPLDHLATQLINDVADLPNNFVLVLDDYHYVRDPAVHVLLSRLLERRPPQLHLVVVTRVEPPLSLSLLRAQGQALEIRMRDLRFGSDEIRAFVKKATGHTLSPDLLEMLETRTEGWGVGLRLAVLAVEESGDLAQLTSALQASQRHIIDYLTDEVIAHQSPETQQFLLRTSILGRLCAPLAAELLGEPVTVESARATIASLEAANLFLLPLDQVRHWYRYHALFREILAGRLEESLAPADLRALHRRACTWLAREGLVDEALHHALAAEDPKLAAAVVEQSVPDALNRLDRELIERWLALLPPDVVDRRPLLLVARAWANVWQGRNALVAPILERIRRLLPGEPEERRALLEATLMAFAVWDAWQTLQPERMIELGEQVFATVPPQNSFAHGTTFLYYCAGLHMAGRSAEVLRLCQERLNEAGPTLDAYTSRVHMAQMMMAMLLGQWAQAKSVAQPYLTVARRQGFAMGAGWAHYVLGICAFERMQLDVAVQHFSAVRELRYATSTQLVIDSLIGLSLVSAAQGQHERAECWLDEAADMTQQTGSLFFLEEVNSARIRLALNRGHLDEAVRRLAVLGPIEVRLHPMELFELPYLTAARVLAAKGGREHLAQAATLVDALLALLRRVHHYRFEAETLLAQALVLEKEGQPERALKAVRQAVLLAEQTGGVRPFVEMGEPLLPHMRQLRAQGVAASFLDDVLRHSPAAQTSQARSAAAQLFEPLTNREIDILELLAQRLSNKEIAEALVIAPSTVQTHLANVFQKLNAENRRDVVIKARAYGILA